MAISKKQNPRKMMTSGDFFAPKIPFLQVTAPFFSLLPSD
jgi:hypothetical protein